MNKYIGILVGMLALLAACNTESLEDTYKEYAGDGEIRYLGKCTDLRVASGWQRILVNWKNNVDPAVQQIKVTWLLDNKKDSVLLERGTTEYSIRELDGKPLEDGNYEISVSGVDINGNTSIANTTYARPYTYTHEEIRAFNRIISKVYFIKDRVILFFSDWQDNMKEASLSYTKADGSSGKLALTKEFFNKIREENNGLYCLLEDAIHPDGQLVLNRRAELPNCKDEIEFEPYVFDTDKVYEADFIQEIRRQFGYGEIPEAWADTVQTVYLDRNISTFSSLLNLPKLNKLVLGSRRYQLPEAINDAVYGQSKVSDKATSDFVLKILHELNGLVVERYNKHFQELSQVNFITEQGMPLLPDVDFMDLSGLLFTEYPQSLTVSGLANLTDDNLLTYWEPEPLNEYTVYELTLKLNSPKTINGLCLVQRQYGSAAELAIAPEYVKVKVSQNGLNWEDATYAEETPLGKSNGETNYIPFSKEVQADTYQYVQIQVNTSFYGSYYRTSIAEIRLY